MKTTCRTHSRSFRRAALISSAAALLAPAAFSATFTWSNSTGNWSDPTRWSPSSPVSAADTELVFGGTGGTGYTSTDDLGTAFSLNILTLNSTATVAETIAATAGSSLNFVVNGASNPVISQGGTGAFNLGIPLTVSNPLLLIGGPTAGIVSLQGIVSGAGGLTFTGGKWRITNIANAYTGGTNVGASAFVELASDGAAPQSISFATGATSLLGGNTGNTLTINGGTLKLTTSGIGSLALGGARPVTFGANGGTLDLTNVNTVSATAQGGNITGGDLALTLNSTVGNPAVIKFNGGQLGLQTNNATDGNWGTGNALRISSFAGTGPVRFEITNGATLRSGVGNTANNTVTQTTTLRGVVGGDPTSGPAGTVLTGISRSTGRFIIDAAPELTYTNLTFEGATQVGVTGTTRALNGNIIIGGGANAGYVAFNGRGTGTALNSTVNAPNTNTAGQNILWLLRNANGTLTIQDGGIADFNTRIRSDTSGPNGNGVALDGPATINAGGTLRFAQSVSNFTPGIPGTTASVGDILIYGDITGQGTTAKDSVLSILLPQPQPGAAVSSGVPATLTTDTNTTTNIRPYGGLVFDDSRGTADLIVNGTGFGGLKVEGLARPNGLIQGNVADPVTNDVKVASVLTSARLSRITGTGGYLTAAPAGAAFSFPAGGEWAPGVTVGLKIVDSNVGAGTDVSVAAISSFNHNIVIDTGATLDTGAGAFTIGSTQASTLVGTGKIIGSGGVTVAAGSTIAPGLAGLGTLTVGNFTIGGSLQIDATNAPTSDQLIVLGNLTLSAGSTLLLPGTNTYGTADITFATYTGALLGTFTNTTGLPGNYLVDYTTPNAIKLVFNTPTDIWNGNVNGNWDHATLNWQGGVAFTDIHNALFDDTAAGTHIVTIVGGDVAPNKVTVNTAAGYSITGSAGNAIVGSAALIKQGAGTLTISGPHRFSGGTTVTGGTLRLGANESLPDGGTVVVSSGATLDANGKTETTGALTINGTLNGGGTINASASFGPAATGAVAALTGTSLSLGTGASLTATGAVSVTGTTTLGDGATLTAASNALSSDVIKNGTGAGATISGPINLGGATRTYTISSGTGPDLTLGGAISNGGLTKAGPGILLLNGASTYSGSTTISGGILRAGAANSFSATSDITVGAGATLDNGGFSVTTGGISGTGTIALNGGALTANFATDSIVATLISGSGAFLKTGPGVATINTANTYSGGTFISGGRIRSGNVNALGASGSTTTVSTGGILVLTVGSQAQTLVLDGGILSGVGLANGTNIITGELTVASPSTIELFDHATPATASEMFLGTVLHGSGNLSILANSTVTSADGGPGFRPANITTNSDYSGIATLSQRAKIDLRGPGVGVASQFSSFGSATIRLNTGTLVFGASSSTGSYSQINVRADHNNNYGNNIELLGTGSAVLSFVNIGTGDANVEHTFGDLKIGDQQRLVITKNHADYTGFFPTVHLQGGVAEISPNDPIAALGGGNLRFGAVTESVAGSGFSMEGLGTLTLSGASNYTGPTRINNGTVILSGSIAGSSGIAVNNGTLTGGGTTGVAVTVGDGIGAASTATIAPGTPTTIGNIFTGPLSLLADGQYKLELSTDNLSTDQIFVGGPLTLGSGIAALNATNLGSNILNNAETFTIAIASGAVTGTFAGLPENAALSLNGTNFNIHYLPNSVVLQAVPEPGAIVSLFGGAALLLGLRRRRG